MCTDVQDIPNTPSGTLQCEVSSTPGPPIRNCLTKCKLLGQPVKYFVFYPSQFNKAFSPLLQLQIQDQSYLARSSSFPPMRLIDSTLARFVSKFAYTRRLFFSSAKKSYAAKPSPVHLTPSSRLSIQTHRYLRRSKPLSTIPDLRRSQGSHACSNSGAHYSRRTRATSHKVLQILADTLNPYFS